MTAETLRGGGTPMLWEVDPEAYTADPADAARRLTGRTRAGR